ncbi:TerC family protein [Rhodopirellula sp. JC740]|uniref:TerC family protein n=1 Tax=Rhodopirellula halodulae TaxID=2894198 RepID=A0ABS8NIU4_9BACT|nr:TerC family protein [Rhodopirellula sp. JC740]MCC9643488.1 TerC family protein [Rhodopirellula sp. JC740]
MNLLASSVQMASDAPLWSMPSLIALFALTLMEIVLGIDNIVFIAILTGKLPAERRSFARRFGLFLAMGMRILLLMMIGWLMSLQSPLFELSSLMPIESLKEYLTSDGEVNEISGRDLILLLGGLFLMFTAVREIHHKIEGERDDDSTMDMDLPEADAAIKSRKPVTVGSVLFQIAVMDVIFSLDSVITAVGMASHLPIMIGAVVISVGVMITFANQISDFVQEHPTVKMLALSFLILISVVLLSEAVGTPINKGYVYFAMAFSLMVEFLNLRMAKKAKLQHA